MERVRQVLNDSMISVVHFSPRWQKLVFPANGNLANDQLRRFLRVSLTTSRFRKSNYTLLRRCSHAKPFVTEGISWRVLVVGRRCTFCLPRMYTVSQRDFDRYGNRRLRPRGVKKSPDWNCTHLHSRSQVLEHLYRNLQRNTK